MSEIHSSTATEQVTFDALEADGCWCDDHDLPCFECYQSGRRNLPGGSE